MYNLRKKYKNTNFPISRYTTTDCFFKVYIDKTYVNYYNSYVAKDLATLVAYARTDEVTDMEKSLINTIKGLGTCAGQRWHVVNKVFIPINYDSAFHWVLAVIALKDRCIRMYDSMASSQKQTNKDCGVFVAIYVGYLSERLGIPCSGIDAQYHRLRYASVLCKYWSENAENRYFSENDDPPRPRSKFAQKKTDSVFHIK
ncbi:hypothetical protein BC332_03724 [Capsicum chinense]|nr:hypothetical protein BC332_03724 [Capsicum chinense]